MRRGVAVGRRASNLKKEVFPGPLSSDTAAMTDRCTTYHMHHGHANRTCRVPGWAFAAGDILCDSIAHARFAPRHESCLSHVNEQALQGHACREQAHRPLLLIAAPGGRGSCNHICSMGDHCSRREIAAPGGRGSYHHISNARGARNPFGATDD